MTPIAAPGPDGTIQLPPVLDMLGVRYVIFRGSPLPGTLPAFQGPDYWVSLNPLALPRAYVPQRVEWAPDDKARLEKLASPQFNPREVAYVESPVDVPTSCSGTAEIIAEIPTCVTVSARTETAGLVVLADLWDQGWRAYLDGKRVPILRANHAVRGVVVPRGTSRLEFRYEPASFSWGLRMCGLAVLVLAAWSALVAWKSCGALSISP